MLRDTFDRLWHRVLRRPYRLALPINQGTGEPVLLLHGIGASGHIWQHVAEVLQDKPYHLIAPDLLGFGASPKPQRLDYSVDDHARAVIATIQRQAGRQPLVIVGHSMGCLIAVRIARLRPDLVKRLILYQMPLYAGLPNRRHYTVRRDLYFRIYKRLMEWPAAQTQTGLRRAVIRMTGLHLTPDIWQPFRRSLRSTIMEQTTLQDLTQLRVPLDIIYGSLDAVVIRGKPRKVFAQVLAPLETHTLAQLHRVTVRASKFIAGRIRMSDADIVQALQP